MMKGLYQKLILVEDAPMEPADLLVALHNVDCRGNENLMKAVIKGDPCMTFDPNPHMKALY